MACSFKQWHKSVQNNRYYNLKGIIDKYDFGHIRAALKCTLNTHNSSTHGGSGSSRPITALVVRV